MRNFLAERGFRSAQSFFGSMTQIRFHSILAGKVPPKITQTLEKSFTDLVAYHPQKVYKKQIIDKSADKMLEVIRDDAEQGCVDSKQFLDVIAEYKKPKNKILFLEGSSPNPKVGEYFAHLMASVIDRNLTLTSTGLINERGKLSEIGPHSDGSRQGVNVRLSILYGQNSQGDGITGFIDLEKLYEKLSDKAKAVLAEPIYGYTDGIAPSMLTDPSMIANKPIVYRDEDGQLIVNFSYDVGNTLACDYSNTKFSVKEVDDGIEEIGSCLDKMIEAGEFEAVRIRTGTMAINKNKETLHFKTGDFKDPTNPDNIRVVGFNSYGPSSFGVASVKSSSLKGDDRSNQI